MPDFFGAKKFAPEPKVINFTCTVRAPLAEVAMATAFRRNYHTRAGEMQKFYSNLKGDEFMMLVCGGNQLVYNIAVVFLCHRHGG